MQRHSHKRSGFTLVELLVALFITAIMFTVGYRALEQALTGRKEVEQQAARLIAIQQAMRWLEQDFELLQPRPVRSLLGDSYDPALTTAQTTTTTGATSLGSSATSAAGSSTAANSAHSTHSTNSAPIVTLTRGGWTNLAGIQRSELQRVTYMLDQGTLTRAYYPVLDATASVALVQRPLLDHVRRFSLRFMDAGRQWRSDWPATELGTVAQKQSLRFRPVAVEITLELDDWGTLVRVVEIAG